MNEIKNQRAAGDAMAFPFIRGRLYRTRDPDVTFQAGRILKSCGLIFGCEFHTMGGYVGPATRLPNGRVSADKESPGDLKAVAD